MLRSYASSPPDPTPHPFKGVVGQVSCFTTSPCYAPRRGGGATMAQEPVWAKFGPKAAAERQRSMNNGPIPNCDRAR